MIVPAVGVNAFAVTRSRPETTCGRDADSPASTNDRSQHDEHGQAQQRTVVSDGDQQHDGHRGECLEDVGPYEHIATPPAIEEHPGEGADHPESGSGSANAEATFTASGWRSGKNSAKVASQALQQTVAELAHEPDGEELAELPGGEELGAVRGSGARRDATGPGPVRRSLSLDGPGDEVLHRLAGLAVGVLHRWGLHEVDLEADRIGPPIPRSSAIFAARTASMITPALFGESQTSSLHLQVQRHVAECPGPPVGRTPTCGRSSHGDVVRRDRCARCRAGIWCDAPGDVTAWVLDTFLDSRRSRSSMFMKSMLPPTFNWYVRSRMTPPILEELGHHPMGDRRPHLALDVVANGSAGRPRRTSLAHPGALAMKTGRALTKSATGIDRALAHRSVLPPPEPTCRSTRRPRPGIHQRLDDVDGTVPGTQSTVSR
jgi:hypothetical protein